MEVLTCEAIRSDGTVWWSYVVPLECHPDAVNDPEEEIRRFARAVKSGVQEMRGQDKGFSLADPPLRFAKVQMSKEEYEATPCMAGFSKAWDNFMLGKDR